MDMVFLLEIPLAYGNGFVMVISFGNKWVKIDFSRRMVWVLSSMRVESQKISYYYCIQFDIWCTPILKGGQK
jgi:hypothetical protein